MEHSHHGVEKKKENLVTFLTLKNILILTALVLNYSEKLFRLLQTFTNYGLVCLEVEC